MGNSSLADTQSSVQVLVAGLRANLDKLSKRGVDEAFVSSIENTNASLATLNAEQEALKSRLKEKTAQLDDSVARLKSLASEAKKVIKITIPQTGWREFGISDVR